MKPVKAMSAPMYNCLMLVLVTVVLVGANPDSSMTYTVDGGDGLPVTPHQNLTTCSGVPVELSVCVPTARPGSLLSLKVKGQAISSLSSDTCVRVLDRFATSQPVVFSYDEEEFVFDVKVSACASRKRRSWTERISSPTSWINSDDSMSRSNSGQSAKRYAAPMSLSNSAPRTTCVNAYDVPGIRVLCDSVTDGGNWIVFQRRTIFDVDFYRNWGEYVSGFGDVTRDHWLGLENIHTLCPPSKPCRLRVDMKAPKYHNGRLIWAEYSSFSLTGYSDNYRLSISGYNSRSTIGDALAYHNGRPFSTKDKDNDHNNCPRNMQGAWWYGDCSQCNLNGRFGNSMDWENGNDFLEMNYTEMKIHVVR